MTGDYRASEPLQGPPKLYKNDPEVLQTAKVVVGKMQRNCRPMVLNL
jgi:hypothetical protein